MPGPSIAAADLATRDFRGVELLKAGTWHPLCGPPDWVVDVAMLRAMESTARSTGMRVPIKLGHNFDQMMLVQDGLPSAGWVENIRVEGDVLLGDLVRVPEKIAQVVEAGGYRTLSIEAWGPFEFAGTVHPLALTAVALLGEDLPAVQTLDDIVDLYRAARADTPRGQITRFARAEAPFAGRSASRLLVHARGGLPPASPSSGAPSMTKPDDQKVKDKAKFTSLMAGLRASFASFFGMEDESAQPDRTAAVGASPEQQAAIVAAQAEATAAKAAATLAQQQVAAMQAQAADTAAAARIESLVQAGKVTPAMVMRDAQGKPSTEHAALLSFAKTDPAGFDALWAKAPVVHKPGTHVAAATGDAALAECEPTENQIQGAMAGGKTRDDAIKLMRRFNADKKGIQLPAEPKPTA